MELASENTKPERQRRRPKRFNGDKGMEKGRKTKPFSITSGYYCLAYRLEENEGSMSPGEIVCRNAGSDQPVAISRSNEATEEMTTKLGTLYDFISHSLP